MLVTSHTLSSSTTWTPPTGMTEAVDAASGAAAATVEYRITVSTDDAKETSGTMNTSGNDLDFEPTAKIGFRFPAVSIPDNATITNAYLEVYAKDNRSDATNMTFYGEAADNAVTFTTTANDITDRTTTTASVNWPSVPAFAGSTTYQTLDISPIIQEVVDRVGWTSGNAIVVIATTASGLRKIKSEDGNAANAPLLHVEYRVPGQAVEASYALQATAGASGAKTATAGGDADVGNTHILAFDTQGAGSQGPAQRDPGGWRDRGRGHYRRQDPDHHA